MAPNPGPMTERGTNTYLVGRRDLAVVDPGPDDPRHLSAILYAIADAPVRAILVTHAHLDHSALAPSLSVRTGAPVLAFGPAGTGRSETMARLAAEGLVGGGEGVDRSFAPDRRLADGDSVAGEDWRLMALRTPGHTGDHLSFVAQDAVFTGDLVMGWSTSLISPPDGDLSAFLASCERLRAHADRPFLPGHGAPVADPSARLDALIAHRRRREAAILAALDRGQASLGDLAGRVYADTPPHLHAAASRNLFAHLVALWEAGAVTAEPALSEGALFALAGPGDATGRGRRAGL